MDCVRHCCLYPAALLHSAETSLPSSRWTPMVVLRQSHPVALGGGADQDESYITFVRSDEDPFNLSFLVLVVFYRLGRPRNLEPLCQW